MDRASRTTKNQTCQEVNFNRGKRKWAGHPDRKGSFWQCETDWIWLTEMFARIFTRKERNFHSVIVCSGIEDSVSFRWMYLMKWRWSIVNGTFVLYLINLYVLTFTDARIYLATASRLEKMGNTSTSFTITEFINQFIYQLFLKNCFTTPWYSWHSDETT